MQRLLTAAASRPALGAAAVRAMAAPRRALFTQATALRKQHKDFAPIINGQGASYAESMFEKWKANPASVHSSWDAYFRLEQSQPEGIAYQRPGAKVDLTSASPVAINETLKIERLLRAFQVRGHAMAKLDPLGIMDPDLDAATPPELSPEFYGFTSADMQRTFTVPKTALFPGGEQVSLQAFYDKLVKVYSSYIGFEFKHIQDEQSLSWLRERIERERVALDVEEKKSLMKGLVASEGFEKFLQKKFPSEKRFGLDGCEVLIPGMNRMVERFASHGVDQIVFGMPHRGRLNVLHNVMRKPLANILREFTTTLDPDDEGSGDVKYHLGNTCKLDINGKQIHLSLLANPSHLETVDPVVQGKVRAEQLYRKDADRKRVVPVLLHGDAAFAGQGVVFETFGMSELPEYTTGGTIHIVVNNQIGFTTDPRFSRSTPYCTDIAKMVSAPVFHVNADQPEEVARVFDLAVDWRQQFGKDVVIDLICYRRYGHNEADQAMFTQPRMYKTIEKHVPIASKYASELVSSKSVEQDWIAAEMGAYETACNAAWDAAPTQRLRMDIAPDSRWFNLDKAPFASTGVDIEQLRAIGKVGSTVPADFGINKTLKRIIDLRLKALEKGEDLDWALGEILAFGSLLADGHHVRLSGQDVERGTFSHRHAVLHDQDIDGKRFTPLTNVGPGQFTVCNSHLSEYAVVGFELGYSGANPWSLVCWEAQFGDFVNGAQCVIDQYLSSSEAKWKRMSHLVMLLPHGYEGMGPEHSSCRIERFLQGCDDDETWYLNNDPNFETLQLQRCNWQVANCTTPANYFHILRRQLYRPIRKPLVMATPKSLLRHPMARSKLEEFGPGTDFVPFIPETNKDIFNGSVAPQVQRLILCSGKIYYELVEERARLGLTNIAIARVEQISPFPFGRVAAHAAQFPQAEVVWVQEEPRNQGPWSYVRARIETALSKTDSHANKRPRFVGRDPAAATATGDKEKHKHEQHQLIDDALKL